MTSATAAFHSPRRLSWRILKGTIKDIKMDAISGGGQMRVPTKHLAQNGIPLRCRCVTAISPRSPARLRSKIR